MSAYHRLISYIYAYEGGIKGEKYGICEIGDAGNFLPDSGQRPPCLCGRQPDRRIPLAGQEESVSAPCLSVAEMGSSVPSSIVKILKEAAAIWKSAVV